MEGESLCHGLLEVQCDKSRAAAVVSSKSTTIEKNTRNPYVVNNPYPPSPEDNKNHYLSRSGMNVAYSAHMLATTPMAYDTMPVVKLSLKKPIY